MFSALSACGQETVTRAEFQKAMEDLKEQIRSLKGSAIPAPPATVNTTGGTTSGTVTAKPDQDPDLVREIARLKRQVADLEAARKEQTDLNTDHSKMLRDIAMGRATPEGGQHFVPNVQAISDDSDARRVLVNTVVHDMTRNAGELRIRNDMIMGQSLVVNGVDSVYIPPRSVRIVTVPSGTATTELAGEGTKSWMIGAPNYSQEVIIAPAIRTNMASAGSPWQYNPATGVWWRTLQ